MSKIKKLDLRSMDIIREQKEKLRKLFPEVFTENKIDFEKLKLALGEAIDGGKERYGMVWPGKADCFKIIQSSSIGTLKPCREESVNFDTNENLFIEGDNLEVLKLLQKSYYGKVKMIYIDPPYNTGNDFIYPDDYKENLTTYLQYTGQVDAQGKRFSTNTDTEGRFHSKWINMMYPRLFLAKNLLSVNGVVFISIDDNEVSNLRKICDEIFGEENFIGQIINKSNPRGSQEVYGISAEHEYVLCYAKNEGGFYSIIGRERDIKDKEFSFETKDGKKARLLGLRKRGGDWRRSHRPNMFYAFYVNPITKRVSLIKDVKHAEEVLPIRPDGEESRWTWGKKTSEARINELVAKEIKRGDKMVFDIYRIDLLEDEHGNLKREKLKSVWVEKELNYQHARQYFKSLFGSSEIFDFPKPPELIRKMLISLDSKDGIILDFFAGSSSTAHAVIDLNKDDGGTRRFIMIQLPESISENSEAYKMGFKTIADIGKERIRRVIKNIEKETNQTLFKNKKMDLGFKVFKLDKSNFKIWDTEQISPDKASLEKQLELHINHIDYKSSQDDILYEILLKAGFELTTKIEKIELAGKAVYSVEGGAMLICLEKELTKELIKAMAEKQPSRVICLDLGFANNDQLKTNAVQIMKSKGVDDFRTV